MEIVNIFVLEVDFQKLCAFLTNTYINTFAHLKIYKNLEIQTTTDVVLPVNSA